MALMSVLQMSSNETHAQQLYSLRLQRESIEAREADRIGSRDDAAIESLPRLMATSVDELGEAARSWLNVTK